MGYKTRNAIKKTAQGAAIGSVIPGVGTALGAGIGAVTGFVTSLFDTDPEEELRKRKDEMIAKINAERAKRMSLITQESANARNSNAQGAMARAIDSGRDPSNIEDSLLVANQQNAQASNQAVNQADQYFNDQVLGVEGEYASRPLETPLSETLMDAGSVALQGYYQNESAKRNQQYIDAYTKNADTAAKSVIAPVTAPSVTTGKTATNVPGVTLNAPSPTVVPSSPQFQGLLDDSAVADSFNINKRIAKTYRVPKMSAQSNLMSRAY